MSGWAENSALLSLDTWNVNVWPDSLLGPALMFVAKCDTVCGPAVLIAVWSGLAGRAKLRASVTGVAAVGKVCGALGSTPPLAVPPSSCATTVTIALPKASGAGVKVSLPVASTAGCALNRPLLSLVTLKLTVWPLSSAGPGLTAVAQAAL